MVENEHTTQLLREGFSPKEHQRPNKNRAVIKDLDFSLIPKEIGCQ
jgi:hypothetical protein